MIRKELVLVLFFFLKSSKLSMLSSLFSFLVYDFFTICWQYAFCCFSVQVHWVFFQFLLLLVVLLKDFILQNRCVPFLNSCLIFLFLNSSLLAVGNNLPFYSILEFLPSKVQNALHFFLPKFLKSITVDKIHCSLLKRMYDSC